MIINLKNYLVDMYYNSHTKIENIDVDFWGDMYVYDLEEEDLCLK